MKKMFGYIRVSTAKQGEGVSLAEQKRAIGIYANRNQLEIEKWFEEKETAAKSGRPVFSEMLKLLRKGKAQGVIIHKIDRSARNLRDWADIGELIDSGIEIHFAHEALDLAARSGRLSADIQAVIAADYIRNLREETKKGMYGRLRQGLYPLPAPVGYLDTGSGNVKEIDPAMGPLIQQLYKLYATRRYGFRELSAKMFALGLRSKRGGRVGRTGIATILHNPFYIGLMRIKSSSQIFQGKHNPLIDKELFDRVQNIVSSKTASTQVRHNFLFRRRIKCGICGGILTGELQKGHVYYRCHSCKYPLPSLREDRIEVQLDFKFRKFLLTDDEVAQAKDEFRRQRKSICVDQQSRIAALELRLNQTETRMDRLADKFIDDLIDQAIYNREKERLLHEIVRIKEQIKKLKNGSADPVENFEQLLSLVNTYFSGNTIEKQEFLDFATSNFWTFHKSLEIPMSSPFLEAEKRWGVLYGGPQRDKIRAGFANSRKKSPRSASKHRSIGIVFTKAEEDIERQKNKKPLT